MDNIKISATIELSGAVLYSNKEVEENPRKYTKLDSMFVNFMDKDPKTKKPIKKSERLVFALRKSKPATQVINITSDAYYDWIKAAPIGVNPKDWKKKSEMDKIRYHLDAIAFDRNGKVVDFKIFSED